MQDGDTKRDRRDFSPGIVLLPAAPELLLSVRGLWVYKDITAAFAEWDAYPDLEVDEQHDREEDVLW